MAWHGKVAYHRVAPDLQHDDRQFAGAERLADHPQPQGDPLESTSVSWRPVFNVLEEGRTIVLVNPQRIKHVPGRKTDVKDAVRLAPLDAGGHSMGMHPVAIVRSLETRSARMRHPNVPLLYRASSTATARSNAGSSGWV